MSVKRIVASALLALTTVGAQVTYGAPARSAATLRAHWCCATRCDHALPAARAAQCCDTGIEDAAASVGTRAPSQAPDVAPDLQVALGPFGAPSTSSGCVTVSVDAVRVRGAPLYLLTRSLRI